MSTYLYGVVRWPAPQGERDLGTGIGQPPAAVRLLRHEAVAALASHAAVDDLEAQGIRALRRDARAHAAVLNHVISRGSVLPFQFGVILPDDRAVIERILKPRYRQIVVTLDRLDGMVELTLRANYLEERVLQEVVSEQPHLLASRGRTSYQSKIELGRRVATAVQAKQRQEARWLLAELSPLVRDVKVARPSSGLAVLQASFLIRRSDVPRFDAALEKLNARVSGRIQLDCVGPLPPYSFVDLKL